MRSTNSRCPPVDHAKLTCTGIMLTRIWTRGNSKLQDATIRRPFVVPGHKENHVGARIVARHPVAPLPHKKLAEAIGEIVDRKSRNSLYRELCFKLGNE